MKLLNYTSIRYLLFAALMLFISVPVFYVVLDKIFIEAIDKDLYQQASEIPAHIVSIKSDRDLALWKTLDNDLEIVSADSITLKAEPFTAEKFRKTRNKKGDFRVLQKKITILDKDYIVQIESSLIEKEDLIKTILFIQLGLFFLLLFGAVIINYFINKKVWKPFYESLVVLKNFDIENADIVRYAKGKIIEFNQLNDSIHQLFIRVRKSYLSQKEFIENASHELQTPLTIIKFKLELLLQEKHLSQSQSLLISDMYKVIEQMEELNSNLLLLSKIENGQFTSMEAVWVVDVTGQVIDELLLIAESKSQKVIANYFEKQGSLQSNKMLLKILVKNLLLNALQYSDSGASIQVFVGKNSLKISNPGKQLGVLQDKLFSRFNKNNSYKGNGLGLSIVKTIADLYHYRVAYEYEGGCHSFVLSWDN
ncbi:MAG TPA: histidine kinase dimerization/phospho-acceptor domain-containing protein [Arachidicoccus sp.]